MGWAGYHDLPVASLWPADESGGLLLEDYLMGAGLIISFAVTAFVVDTAFNGVGLPIASLPKHERQRIQFGSWMIQKFWAPAMAFVKISIVIFVKRLFGTIRAYVVISYCLIGFITAWALAALLTNIFQCIPVQYYYNKDLKGHCMSGQVQFFQAMGSIALVEDKLALTLVFSLGGLVCIFSLMRLIEFREFQLTDLAASSAKESIWTCLELDVAIICGCLPFLNPLVQGVRSKVRSDFRELDSDCGESAHEHGRKAMAAANQQSSDLENNRRNVDGGSTISWP
ncbi:hypothetical protein PDIDSM_1838, partial [Penicillium digitatum]